MFSSNTTQVSDGGYQISRSLRFNSADTAYLNRTPATTTNRKTWTWSGWIKRSNLSVLQALFGSKQGVAATPRAGIQIEDTNAITFIYNSTGSANSQITTTAVYRDVSAWYHIILAVDTTQATNTNRLKLYVNGVQVTVFSTADYPTLNEDLPININTAHMIGSFDPAAGADRYFRGYMTEVNFIDGQALTPSSFGETNAQTGVWQPKAYSGSYGTNGFYLNFSDNSNITAATLGKDYSGNGNNWTPNGFLVSAGVNNDSLVDSPTSYGTDTGVGGTVRGNYATLNPLSKSSSITLANGNLDASTAGGGAWGSAVSTLGLSSGKWYFEATCGSGVANPMVGYTSSSADINTYLGGVSGSAAYFGNGSAYINGSPSPYGASYTTGDVIGVAIDMDAGTIVCYKNNTTQGTLVSGLTGTIFVGVSSTNGTAMTVNMGQRPFAHTAPSGFKALCTQNLPTPTIGATTATQAGKYFNTVLYSGNGTTQSITGVGFQPDWTWIKSRNNGSTNNSLYDAVRGAGKVLFTNGTEPEYTVNDLTSFNADGFSVSTVSGTRVETNASGYTYVGWNWKANGSGSSNTAGSITSTVSANTTSGFSVVTYTGTGANATVGHGIGIAPRMVIVKSRSTPASTNTAKWHTYHASLGASSVIWLNSSDAAATSANYWNATAPTSSVFSVGTDIFGPNVITTTYVAYCFAEVAGYSKFGSYTGNGSADGAFVFTGFRPAYLMVKRTDASFGWWIFDATRNPSNVVTFYLAADSSGAENNFGVVDFTSNGFKFRDSSQGWNASGGSYIFMAFASVPQKFSLAR